MFIHSDPDCICLSLKYFLSPDNVMPMPIQWVKNKSTRKRDRLVGSRLAHSLTKEKDGDTTNVLSRGTPEWDNTDISFYLFLIMCESKWLSVCL